MNEKIGFTMFYILFNKEGIQMKKLVSIVVLLTIMFGFNIDVYAESSSLKMVSYEEAFNQIVG